MKNIKEKIESNIIIVIIGISIVSYSAGVGTYDTILDIANLDKVQKGTYISTEEFSKNFIKWDSSLNGFVLSKDEKRIIENLNRDQLKELYNLHLISISVIHRKYQRLKDLESTTFDNEILPKMIDSIVSDSFLKYDIDKFQKNNNLEIKEYINIFSKVTERIFIEKDKYIKKVTLEEKKETSKLNNHIARWIPPSTINVSMLNTRERWYNQINSEFDLIHYEIKDLFTKSWLPDFVRNFFSQPRILSAFKDVIKNKNDFSKFSHFIYKRILMKSYIKYEEISEAVDDKRQKVIDKSEKLFLSMLLQDITSHDYSEKISDLLNKAKNEINTLKNSMVRQ